MKPILRVALGLGLEFSRYLAFCAQTIEQLHRLRRRRARQVRLQKRYSLLHWRLQGGIWRCPSPTPSRYNWVAVSCGNLNL